MTNCHRSRLLAAYLRRLINANGPLTVARYMSEALNNPSFGYYTTRDPLALAVISRQHQKLAKCLVS